MAGKPGILTPIALSPADETLTLPDALDGVVNLGLDRLSKATAKTEVSDTRVAISEPLDPCVMLQRRLVRILLGGAASLPASAGHEVATDATKLRAQMMPGAATMLEGLHQSARRAPSRTQGGGDAASLGLAFAQSVAYRQVMMRELLATAWNGIPT